MARSPSPPLRGYGSNYERGGDRSYRGRASFTTGPGYRSREYDQDYQSRGGGSGFFQDRRQGDSRDYNRGAERSGGYRRHDADRGEAGYRFGHGRSTDRQDGRRAGGAGGSRDSRSRSRSRSVDEGQRTTERNEQSQARQDLRDRLGPAGKDEAISSRSSDIGPPNKSPSRAGSTARSVPPSSPPRKSSPRSASPEEGQITSPKIPASKPAQASTSASHGRLPSEGPSRSRSPLPASNYRRRSPSPSYRRDQGRYRDHSPRPYDRGNKRGYERDQRSDYGGRGGSYGRGGYSFRGRERDRPGPSTYRGNQPYSRRSHSPAPVAGRSRRSSRSPSTASSYRSSRYTSRSPDNRRSPARRESSADRDRDRAEQRKAVETRDDIQRRIIAPPPFALRQSNPSIQSGAGFGPGRGPVRPPPLNRLPPSGPRSDLPPSAPRSERIPQGPRTPTTAPLAPVAPLSQLPPASEVTDRPPTPPPPPPPSSIVPEPPLRIDTRADSGSEAAHHAFRADSSPINVTPGRLSWSERKRLSPVTSTAPSMRDTGNVKMEDQSPDTRDDSGNRGSGDYGARRVSDDRRWSRGHSPGPPQPIHRPNSRNDYRSPLNRDVRGIKSEAGEFDHSAPTTPPRQPSPSREAAKPMLTEAEIQEQRRQVEETLILQSLPPLRVPFTGPGAKWETEIDRYQTTLGPLLTATARAQAGQRMAQAILADVEAERVAAVERRVLVDGQLMSGTTLGGVLGGV